MRLMPPIKDSDYFSEIGKMSKVYANGSNTRKPQIKDKKKADLNKDGRLSKYEKKRAIAIEKAMSRRT